MPARSAVVVSLAVASAAASGVDCSTISPKPIIPGPNRWNVDAVPCVLTSVVTTLSPYSPALPLGWSAAAAWRSRRRRLRSASARRLPAAPAGSLPATLIPADNSSMRVYGQGPSLSGPGTRNNLPAGPRPPADGPAAAPTHGSTAAQATIHMRWTHLAMCIGSRCRYSRCPYDATKK